MKILFISKYIHRNRYYVITFYTNISNTNILHNLFINKLQKYMENPIKENIKYKDENYKLYTELYEYNIFNLIPDIKSYFYKEIIKEDYNENSINFKVYKIKSNERIVILNIDL